MKPRILDLFCGAGGCTKGYQEAGFYVIGVDVKPQPNYCGDEFYVYDALTVLKENWPGTGGADVPLDVFQEYRQEVSALRLDGFDAIHASPPCQHYAGVTAWRGKQEDHPDLVGPTRELLEATGLPWVMENVKGAPLAADFSLCGSMFGLPIQRHRYFETNWAGVETWGQLGPCGHHPDDYSFDHGGKQPESVYRDAMGCEWMTVAESRQAIPPAYTRFIGAQLLAHHLNATNDLEPPDDQPHRGRGAMSEPGIFDPAEARATGDVCLRCSDPSGYQYAVKGGGYLCPPCCALVDPERVNDETRDELISQAPRSDEEWEALGWRPEATVTTLPTALSEDHS